MQKSSIPYGLSICTNEQLSGVLCGDFLEIIYTPERVSRGAKRQTPDKAKEPESMESMLHRSVARSRKIVRQLCNTNRLYVLHTLTFAVSHPKYFNGERPFDIIPLDSQRDRDYVLKRWKEFVRKLRSYEWGKGRVLRYIAVIEKHTGKRASGDETIKRDTYHIHFLSDRVYGKRLLQAKWRHGFCNYSDWSNGTKSRDLAEEYDGVPPDNPGAYACKYLGKDMDDEYVGRKRYWASKTLIKPCRVDRDEVLALAYGKLPIYEAVKEIHIENATYRMVKATYRVDRKDAGKDNITYPDRKTIRENRAKKRVDDIKMRAMIANIKAKNRERENYEKDNNRRQKNHEQDIERFVVKLTMPYGQAGIRPKSTEI
jgi:hypothetical protein